jgi:peptidylprolyl isomerase
VRASAAKSAGLLLGLATALAAAGCSGGVSLPSLSSESNAATAAADNSPKVQTTDTKEGTGISPRPGQICVVHYTGWLYVNGAKGTKFDSSVDRKKPFSFKLGEHQVIEGWERGVATMKVGGKRTLIIPPELGYGSNSQGKIPANSTLIFEVELLDVKAPA